MILVGSFLFRLQIAELQAQYDHSVAEKEELTRNIAQTAARLKRASKLTTALSDEQVRWTENIAVRMCVPCAWQYFYTCTGLFQGFFRTVKESLKLNNQMSF